MPKKKPQLPGKLPPQVLKLLEKENLHTEDFIACAVGDMDNEGNYCSLWAAFDAKGLYLAFGHEHVQKKRGNKRLDATYTLEKLECTPLDDIEKLKTEQYVTTGRLIAVIDGQDVSLARFSLGRLGDLQRFCDCVNAHIEGRDLTPFLEDSDEALHCPKCGKRFADRRRVCPDCVKQTAIARRLMGYFRDYKWNILVVLILLVMLTAVQIVLPLFSTQALFDDVLRSENPVAERMAQLTVLALIVIGMRLFNIAVTMVYDIVLSRITPNMIYSLKMKIFQAMQRLSISFYSSKQTGSLMERVTRDTMSIYWFFIDGVPFLGYNILLLLGLLGMMLWLSWQLTLMVFGVVPVLLVLVLVGSKVFRRLHHRIWAANARLSSMVSDNVNGQRVIKAFAREEEELSRFSAFSKNLRDSEHDYTIREATLFPALIAVIYILTTLVLVLGSQFVLRGDMGIGQLLTFIIFLTMLQGPIDYLSWVSNWWARCADASQRVFEIIDSDAEIKQAEHPVELEELRGSIEMHELDFEYEPARPIIKRVSLKVEAGQMLGIVGKTGAGKSTIANLISRLYDAKAGTIFIDGVDVKDLPLSLLRRNIGLVSQDIYLFSGTIADNIRYAKPEADMAEVIAAAKTSAAHDFIMKLPDGYETRVGASGQALSGGERQRVSIARAIMQNPRILILDEATAAMDTATERSIQQSLQKLKEGRTTIAIAHRLSTLRDADLLAVIEEGELKEFGTFRELILKKGAFFELYQIQSKALQAMHVG